MKSLSSVSLVMLTIALGTSTGALVGMMWIHENPCEYEDSEWCYWNASTMGNGQGQSFIRMFYHTFYFGDYSHAKD